MTRRYYEKFWGVRYGTSCGDSVCRRLYFNADCFRKKHIAAPETKRDMSTLRTGIKHQVDMEQFLAIFKRISAIDVCRTCRRHERDHVHAGARDRAGVAGERRCLLSAGRFTPVTKPLAKPLIRLKVRAE
jgi:hypothetical protein